jgi:hypothetical protein
MQLQGWQPQLAQEGHEHGQDFGVNDRAGFTDGFHIELIKLTKTSGLGAFIAEHRADTVKLHEAWLLIQLVLDVGPADASGGLRAQRELFAPLIFEGVHLLLDDVGGLTDGAREQVGRLEDRRFDLRIAIALKDLARHALDKLPLLDLAGEDIFDPSDCSDLHRYTLSWWHVRLDSGIGRGL